MTMNSRGYQKSSRNSNAYNQNPTLINRNNTDNYYPQSSSRNYNTSRQFHNGIFTSQLSKREARKKESDLALQIQEVPDYSANKPRTSSKRNGFGRESKDQNYRQSQPNHDHFDVKQQMQDLKTQIYQNVSEVIKEQGDKYDKALMELVTQINTALKRKEQNFYTLRLDTNNIQQEVGKLANNFQTFSKENEEKLQTLVNEMATMSGSKKSKAYGDYGVDLKNSFQGLNSSFSVNLGGQNSNSKLVNEVIYQLDSLKKDLSESKLQIQQITLKLNEKIKQSSTCQVSTNKTESILKEDLIAIIQKKIKEDKKGWKLQEKYESFESKFNSFQQILQKQQQNIFGMNEQLKNTINNQMNPKIKKMENSIVDIYSKIDPLSFENQIREGITKQIGEKLKDTKLLKVRNCNNNEATRINSITGMNEDKITSKQTYLLDQQSYLLDSQGIYLLEEVCGQKRRVKVEENLIYLLGLKGIQIKSCS